MLRLSLLLLALALSIIVPFALWGGHLEDALSADRAVEWLRATGWAWAVGIGLIISDVILPVPSTAVMAALGIIYGPVVGGILSAIGSILAASLAYWLCRALGRRTADRLAGPEGIAKTSRLFRRWGFGLIVVSRWLPILPEAVALLAGLVRVPFWRFAAALACGAIPHGFIFASAGHFGRSSPLAVIAASILVPVSLWFLASRFLPVDQKQD